MSYKFNNWFDDSERFPPSGHCSEQRLYENWRGQIYPYEPSTDDYDYDESYETEYNYEQDYLNNDF